MKKAYIILPIVVILIVCIYEFKPSDMVGNIQIPNTLYVGQSVIENYKYRRMISKIINNEEAEIFEFVNTWCGGGAGCYDHGSVLVQIALNVGDGNFSKYIPVLEKKDKEILISLLGSGVEYGGNSQVNKWAEFESLFPITLVKLHNEAQ